MASLLLLAPVALALAAQRLTTVPVSAQVAGVPPLPTPRPDALPMLEGLIDPLPIVVRDLPDEISRLAGADNDAASLFTRLKNDVPLVHPLAADPPREIAIGAARLVVHPSNAAYQASMAIRRG